MTLSLPTLREAGGVRNTSIRPRFAPIRNEGSLANPGSDFLASLGLSWSPLGAKVNEITALGVSTVFACVHYIASILSTLPLELYKVEPSGARSVANGHPVRRLLKYRPNPVMVPSDVRYALAWNQTLHGNAYAQLVFDRSGRPVEIYPLRSRDVSIWVPPGSKWPEYQVSGSGKVDFKHMMHLRGMSPDGIKGFGPLGMGAGLIGLSQTLEDNASKFFSNGSRPGMIYSAAPGVVLTDNQRTAMREQLERGYQGIENAYRTMVMEGGGKVEYARLPNDSSQFEEIAASVRIQICQYFGVPPHKVGILDRATFSNIEQQQIQAVQDLFLPWCKRWEEVFSGALLNPNEIGEYYFKHNLDGILRGDIAARTAAYASLIQNGVLSVNEVREMEDRDPIADGDGHIRQSNTIPLGSPGPAPAAA